MSRRAQWGYFERSVKAFSRLTGSHSSRLSQSLLADSPPDCLCSEGFGLQTVDGAVQC